MAEASITGMGIAVREVERIINYQFNGYSLLICSLRELSTDHVERRPNNPRLEFLVRMGQFALDAAGWKLFWINGLGTGQDDAEPFSRNSLTKFISLREAWDQDANLIRVANDSGLLPYLQMRTGWRNDFIATRVQAIIGAVLLDAEGRLEQVNRVLSIGDNQCGWIMFDSRLRGSSFGM